MMRSTVRRLVYLASITAIIGAAGVAVWTFTPSNSPVAPGEGPGNSAAPFAVLDKPRPLPELRFTDATGHPVTLQDFRGRLVLLNIWATWCVPCRVEMPTLDRLQAKLGGADFEVVALSIDRQGLDVVKPFYDELGLGALHIYLDPAAKAPIALGATGVPATFLIDAQGREIGRALGPAEWDSPEIEAIIRRYLPPARHDL